MITTEGDVHMLVLGPAWTRDRRQPTGTTIEVMLEPEGPQRGDSPPMSPRHSTPRWTPPPFDSLAQFYRNAYLRWIDATKRRPELRPVRIAEMIRLLQQGHKERPKP